MIPGEVEPDLLGEHLARYALALRYAEGKRILDCGCGAGYGTAELATAASEATGIDFSNDAIEYAREHYARPNVRFITGSCLDLPFPASSFDLVVAFEVIEHLIDFRRFLDECARVLHPAGMLIASTPNKLYYAESRSTSGPNPFHEHEFEAAEFRSELDRVFPHVKILVQNHVECFSFAAEPGSPADLRVDGGSGALTEAHFFVGLCSAREIPAQRSYIYVPTSANLLREREHHIRLLEDELRVTQGWLAQTQDDRNRLLDKHRDLQDSYEEQNRWAKNLDASLKAASERVAQLQAELALQQRAALEMARSYETKLTELEAENLAKTQWAIDTDARLTAEIQRITAEFAECARLLETSEQTLIERTHWAQRLEAERQALEVQLSAVRASRWLKLGRKLGLGPAVQ